MTEKDKWMNMALHDIETAEYNLKGNILDAAAFIVNKLWKRRSKLFTSRNIKTDQKP